jgi:hypothetical protein
MFKLVIKLAIIAAIAHAGIKIIPEFWTYLRFKDRMEETARYAFRATEVQIHAKANKIAMQLEVPLDGEEIVVTRAGQRVTIDTHYTAQLEYLPTKFYPYEFIIHVDEEGSPLGEFLP